MNELIVNIHQTSMILLVVTFLIIMAFDSDDISYFWAFTILTTFFMSGFATVVLAIVRVWV